MRLKWTSVRRVFTILATLCGGALAGGLIMWGLSWLAVSAVEMAPVLIPVDLYPPSQGCVDITPLCP